jgi:hypothetical protein
MRIAIRRIRRSIKVSIALGAAYAALSVAMPVHAQSINAVPDTGGAVAGTASTPIANVAANDTVDGAPATLGASGNATVAQLGTWPIGISLNTATGSVTTTASAAPGIYNFEYQLCDLNAPPDCAWTTDTVTVSASIIANSVTGTAVAGIATKAIANIAATDTVNGAAATLGISGNATVAEFGHWPAGIAIKTAIGAVVTAAAVPAGVYTYQYKLCDKNAPPDCANSTVTINVLVPSAAANPDYGSGMAGIASTLIANVAANDTVNGTPARLGKSATVTPVGTWPTGIVLDNATGAVSATTAVVAGTFQIQYQLCEVSLPSVCSTGLDTALIVPAVTEVQATSSAIGVIHFDWARDGVYCATCNFGEGNARFNWTDHDGHLWVGHLNPATGAFASATAIDEMADTTAFYFGVFNNGPDFAFSTPVAGQDPVSQLVYTRYPPGDPETPSNAGIAFSTPVAGDWDPSFLPGAMGTSGTGPINTVLYQQSQCLSDPVASTLFYDLSTPTQVFWEPVTDAPGTQPVLTPFGSYATFISGGKPGARWVPCTHQLVFIGAAPPNAQGVSYQQVFWFDTDTQVVQQLTVDDNQHAEGFLFQAPEFNDTYVLYTVINDVEIDVYQQTGVTSNGAPTFQLVNQITSPDLSEHYITETEPFINCTPACQTYIFMKLQSTPGENTKSQANGLAVTNINPAQPLFKVLVPESITPTIQRMNPKYFITANGPYLYYSRNTISSETTQFKKNGRWFINMQLGVPSGSCVGSSAEGGMQPGC